MINRISITDFKALSYLDAKTGTIDIDSAIEIVYNGEIIKKEASNEKLCTLFANTGGVFSPNFRTSELGLTFMLRETYILKDSFFNGDRGGHHMPDLYKENFDLWYDVTYRNLVKITFYVYLKYHGLSCENVDFKRQWDQACDVFRSNVAVFSANPWPALALNKPYTDQRLLHKILRLPQVSSSIEKQITELGSKIVYSAADLGVLSSYDHLFGWLKKRELEELVEYEGSQSLLGRNIIEGGNYNGQVYVKDESGLTWIQGRHPSSRLSHVKMQSIADGIVELLKNR